jgi:hypothetical protein
LFHIMWSGQDHQRLTTSSLSMVLRTSIITTTRSLILIIMMWGSYFSNVFKSNNNGQHYISQLYINNYLRSFFVWFTTISSQFPHKRCNNTTIPPLSINNQYPHITCQGQVSQPEQPHPNSMSKQQMT